MKKDYIPVRVGNFSSERKKLRKGTEIAVCEPVASITPTKIAKREQVNVSPQKEKELVPEHLRSLFEYSTENLCDQDKEKVAGVLRSFQDVFSKGSDDLGRATSVKHDIVTGEATPVRTEKDPCL